MKDRGGPVLSDRFCLIPHRASGPLPPPQFSSIGCVCRDGRWVTSQGTEPPQEAGHSEGWGEGFGLLVLRMGWRGLVDAVSIHGQPDWASTSEICVSGSLVNKVGA